MFPIPSQLRYRVTTLLVVIVATTAGFESAHADDATGDPPYNPYATTLAEAHIEATAEGLTGYLQSLVPSAAEKQKRDAAATALVAQLGDANFALREAAMRQLIAMPDVPHEKLQAAVASDDPEIRWRSELVLKHANRPNPLPEAVCRTIAILRIKGTAPILLQVIGQLGPAHVRRAAEDALAATARREDADLLLTAMASEDGQLQAAAITAYAAALGNDAKIELQKYLHNENSDVQLASLRALANLGDRAVVPVLLELLAHEDVNVRASAANLLRGLTGQQFNFIAYEKPENRTVSVDAWRTWVAAKGKSAELTFPLTQLAGRAERGHTLILIYSKHKAIEINAAGETIWEKDDLDFPWAVQRLDNGNTVIGSYRKKYVVEFDPAGEEIWRKDDLPGGVFGLQRLANGNTVLGLHSAKKVIEINRAGETVWEAKFSGQPMGVQRLTNGNTVVALHSGNKVVEVDPAGKVVWEVGGLKIPRTAQRLPNGNTLISDANANRAVEFDRAGEVVWTYAAGGNVYDAQRLANGNTLISSTNGVFIVTPDGETVWEKKLEGAGRAVRF